MLDVSTNRGPAGFRMVPHVGLNENKTFSARALVSSLESPTNITSLFNEVGHFKYFELRFLPAYMDPTGALAVRRWLQYHVSKVDLCKKHKHDAVIDEVTKNGGEKKEVIREEVGSLCPIAVDREAEGDERNTVRMRHRYTLGAKHPPLSSHWPFGFYSTVGNFKTTIEDNRNATIGCLVMESSYFPASSPSTRATAGAGDSEVELVYV